MKRMNVYRTTIVNISDARDIDLRQWAFTIRVAIATITAPDPAVSRNETNAA